MNRLEYDDPKLHPKESEVCRFVNVKVYDGDDKNATFDVGELVVTHHRLIFVQSGSLNGLCLRLNYVVLIEEEKSSSFGFSRTKKLIIHLLEALPGKQPGPVDRSSHNFIRLSFKEGYSSSFPDTLRTVILTRTWETVSIMPSTSSTPSASQLPGRNLRAGIVGIERQIQAKHKATDDSISLAFEDLSKLMVMAKDMVQLSKGIAEKMRERQGEFMEDETMRFKSYLLSLGIEDPVTRDAFRSESKYHETLSRQISTMLYEPIKEIGGMMTLTEAFCRVNRARGLELLSPDDMLKACQIMDSLSLPVSLKVFDSGVKILSTHQDSRVIASTCQALQESGPFSAEEFAQVLGISVVLAKGRLLLTEKAGKACRDDTIEGIKFYPNLFLEGQ